MISSTEMHTLQGGEKVGTTIYFIEKKLPSTYQSCYKYICLSKIEIHIIGNFKEETLNYLLKICFLFWQCTLQYKIQMLLG